MRKLELLNEFAEAMSKLTELMHSSDPFEILNAMDRAIEVVREMNEIMRIDSPFYQEARQNLEKLEQIRSSLIQSL
jgi:hypothetical protein